MFESDQGYKNYNFRSHHVDLDKLASDVDDHEQVQINWGISGRGEPLNPKQIETVKQRKIKAQLNNAKEHNRSEDEYAKICRQETEAFNNIGELENKLRSDYVKKPWNMQFRLSLLKKNVKSLGHKRITVYDYLTDSNEQIIGSQKMDRHNPG